MSPDCQNKHNARMALYGAAESSPKHGKPHLGEAWTEAFNAYQSAIMEPLRQELREAVAGHEQGACCAQSTKAAA